MNAQYGRSAADAAYAEAAAAGPLVWKKVPLIPLGTMALCVCRKAIHRLSSAEAWPFTAGRKPIPLWADGGAGHR